MLKLYRRHSQDCKVHTLKLTPKEKKFYRDCDCPVWLHGNTETEAYPRQAVGTRDWAVAEAKLAAILNDSRDQAEEGHTVRECVEKYLNSRDIAPATRTQFENVLGAFRDYLLDHNVTRMGKLSVDLCEDFVSSLRRGRASTTVALYQSKLRAFLAEAYRRDWIETPWHLKLRPVATSQEQKQPYNDSEIRKILHGVERIKGTVGYAGKPKTFRLLLELMLETGLRVSDAVLFDPAKLTKHGDLWLYSFVPVKTRKDKQRKIVQVFISDKLKQAVDGADWYSVELPFLRSNAKHSSLMVLRLMDAIGKLEGIPHCGPHRLRHTFAVRLLTNGVSLDDVSKLLGHGSTVITQKHYSAWVLSRQLRLANVLRESGVHSVSH